MLRIVAIIGVLCGSSAAFASGAVHDQYVSGKIKSLKAHATDPAIRIEGKLVPRLCDGGQHGWLYFKGNSREERHAVYSTALALSLTGHTVQAYTNTDGDRCRISSIQVLSGLN